MAPVEVDLSESRQGSLYAADIITFILALIAVSLRIWSRFFSRAGLWVDDIFICVAFVSRSIRFPLESKNKAYFACI